MSAFFFKILVVLTTKVFNFNNALIFEFSSKSRWIVPKRLHYFKDRSMDSKNYNMPCAEVKQLRLEDKVCEIVYFKPSLTIYIMYL